MLAAETEKKVLCPICGARQITHYEVSDAEDKKTMWFHCHCGTIFHDEGIDKAAFNLDYMKDYQDKRGVDVRCDYILRTYLPLIEEMISGRKFLDVGFTVPYNILTLKERGWVSTGIDLIPNDFITMDFERFQFEDKFDFIYMGHVLQSFEDPIHALGSAFSMLNKNGILMLTTPAPELVHFTGLREFGHWSSKHAHVYISEKELKRLTLGMGFEWILSRVNFSQRFMTWNDRHLILQRKYA
jgi:SAM-dependent methyltransferase